MLKWKLYFFFIFMIQLITLRMETRIAYCDENKILILKYFTGCLNNSLTSIENDTLKKCVSQTRTHGNTNVNPDPSIQCYTSRSKPSSNYICL